MARSTASAYAISRVCSPFYRHPHSPREIQRDKDTQSMASAVLCSQQSKHNTKTVLIRRSTGGSPNLRTQAKLMPRVKVKRWQSSQIRSCDNPGDGQRPGLLKMQIQTQGKFPRDLGDARDFILREM